MNEVTYHQNGIDLSKSVKDLEHIFQMCQILSRIKHYEAMGVEGVFAVIMRGISLGLNPIEALSGSLYYVKGKVEMSAQCMNYLIRAAGHQIFREPETTDEICVLRGVRKDTGQEWISSFSIDDAKKAKLMKDSGDDEEESYYDKYSGKMKQKKVSPWHAYTADMLFARALSRLGRQLFPDVIKGCYVDGEIPREEDVEVKRSKELEKLPPANAVFTISDEDAKKLEDVLAECDEAYVDKVYKALEKSPMRINSWKDLTPELYARIYKAAVRRRDELKTQASEEKNEAAA